MYVWCTVRTVHHTYTNKDLIKYAATLVNYPRRCILIDYFKKVSLARSNSALPDDGNYTKHIGAVLVSISV